MENDRERIRWIDAAKGIGLILVLIGHAPRESMYSRYFSIGFIFYFIYAFHMDFFFFLSGMVYEFTKQRWIKEKAHVYVRNQAKKLLLPWALYASVIYAARYAVEWIPGVHNLLASSYAMVPFKEYVYLTVLESNPYCVHVWYIYVLFITRFVIYLVDRIYIVLSERKKSLANLFLVVFGTGLVLFLYFYRTHYVFAYLRRFPFYYVLGVLYAKIRGNHTIKLSWPLLAGPVITAFYVIGFDMGYFADQAAISGIFLLHTFLGRPLMILLVCALSQKVCDAKCMNAVKWLGKRTFGIYLLHQPFCAFLGTFLSLILPDSYLGCMTIMLICILSGIFFPLAGIILGYRIGLGRILKSCFNIDNPMVKDGFGEKKGIFK